MTPLPDIMIAPNGARLTKEDHPKLPITIDEIVVTAKECWEVGARGIHAHVRDEQGQHTLDVGLYRELINELEQKIPEIYVQITTEAVGRYSPKEQMEIVRELKPKACSVALREISEIDDSVALKKFYEECREANVAVQHILYDASDVEQFGALIRQGVLCDEGHQLLFVLGRYTVSQQSTPKDIEPFLSTLGKVHNPSVHDWAICAFGAQETECLVAAIRAGGKVRIGFENNLLNADGTLARSTAERVQELHNFLKKR